MEIISINDKNLIAKTQEVLKSGGLIIFPTETCYGAGVDATNKEAVSKVLKYKKRPIGKAISIACYDEKMASEYVEVNSTAKNIYKNFLPGPVTVISKSKSKVDRRLESEKGSLGIRIPAYNELLEIIKSFSKPITSTSANSAGKKTPYNISDIFNNISDKQKNLIDLVIDAGELPQNPPSSVVDTTTEDLKTYRFGSIILNKTKSDNIKTHSQEETIEFAQTLINKNLEKIKTGCIIILLNGELGAGKTHFVKGVAKALNINRIIKSPTYGYVDEHKFSVDNQNGILVHVDAWKIEDRETLDLLKPEDWFKKGNVVCIEWASTLIKLNKDLINLDHVFSININVVDSENREINIYYPVA